MGGEACARGGGELGTTLMQARVDGLLSEAADLGNGGQLRVEMHDDVGARLAGEAQHGGRGLQRHRLHRRTASVTRSCPPVPRGHVCCCVPR